MAATPPPDRSPGPVAFHAHLESLPPGRVVGIRGDTCRCPLARWYRSLHRGAWSVSGTYVFRPDETGRYTEPWERAFVHAIDDARYVNDDRVPRQVTREEALEALAALARAIP